MQLRATRLTAIASAVKRAFSPASLFTNGEQGWWYDPSDFNRYMGSLGPELVTNGDFSDGTTTGWTGSGSAVLSVVAGQLKVENGATVTAGASQTFATIPGATYKWTYYADPATSGGAVIRARDGLTVISTATRTTAGTYEVIFTATGTSTQVQAINASSTLGLYHLIDNISVKELTAISTASMFQDSAGTTPVTAVEQPVGLQLDLSKGLVLGPELVTNGDFSNGSTGWTTTLGWSISGGNLVGTAATNSASQNSVTTAGVWYKVSFNYNATLGNVIRICNTSGTALISFTTASGTSGTVTGYFLATGSTVLIEASNAPYTGTIDNFSVRELPGNHRFQTTSANRPVVSARVNLLERTEDFSNAYWAKANATITANTVVAPDGTLTADTITATTGNGYLTRAGIAVINTTLSLYVKQGVGSRFSIIPSGLSNADTAIFDLSTGSVVQAGANNASASISSVGNGWYRLVVVRGATAGNSEIYIGFLGSSATAGDYHYIWGADLRPTNQGVGLPAYQRVNTSTDYDSTGFPVYIKPNGSNQFMQTNSINFTATDKMTVWQGVRKLSDAGTSVVTELSATINTNNGSFVLYAPSTVGGANYQFVTKGTFVASSTATGYAAPTTSVVTGLADIPSAVAASTIRIDGVIKQVTGFTAGTGNFGNYPTYFYARSGTGLYFNGNDYGSIARGAASTAAQIANGEAYINSKTKAYTP